MFLYEPFAYFAVRFFGFLCDLCDFCGQLLILIGVYLRSLLSKLAPPAREPR